LSAASLRGRLLRPDADWPQTTCDSQVATLMAYNICSLACRCHSGQGVCGPTSAGFDLLSVPAQRAGHLMPHARSAGATLLPTRPI